MVLNFTGGVFGGTTITFAKKTFGKNEKGAELVNGMETEDDEEDGKPAGITAGICAPSALTSSAVRLSATGGHALAEGGFAWSARRRP